MLNSKSSKTKVQIVTEILHDLNFVQDKVPYDWKKRVDNILKQKGVEVHFSTIYDARRKEMKKVHESLKVEQKPVQQQKPVEQTKPVKENPIALQVNFPPSNEDKKISEKLTLADALVIKNFAKNYGGFEALIEAVKAVSALLKD